MATERNYCPDAVCSEHGEIIGSDACCSRCHAEGHHDSQCRYLGNDAWDCGVVDGDFSEWQEG